jgi:hypothetical protein
LSSTGASGQHFAYQAPTQLAAVVAFWLAQLLCTSAVEQPLLHKHDKQFKWWDREYAALDRSVRWWTSSAAKDGSWPTCLIAAWLTATIAAIDTIKIIFLYMFICCGDNGSGEIALLTGLFFAWSGRGSKV